MAQGTDFNTYQHKIEAPMLIDEVSSTEYYVGESNNTKDINKNNWRIKRIWKVGFVWYMGFPNGNQDYDFVWDDRDTYIYYM